MLTDPNPSTVGASSLSEMSVTVRPDRLKEGTEVERRYLVVDQMVSMHSILRDRYKRRAIVLNTSQMGVAIFLAAFAFVDDAAFIAWELQPDRARIVIATAALAILAFSVVEVRADWRGMSERHADAVRRLVPLKAKYRQRVDRGHVDDDLDTEYTRVMNEVVPIPDKLFVPLKALHHYKKRLSTEISENPGVPRWILSIRLRVRSTRSMLSVRSSGAAD